VSPPSMARPKPETAWAGKWGSCPVSPTLGRSLMIDTAGSSLASHNGLVSTADILLNRPRDPPTVCTLSVDSPGFSNWIDSELPAQNLAPGLVVGPSLKPWLVGSCKVQDPFAPCRLPEEYGAEKHASWACQELRIRPIKPHTCSRRKSRCRSHASVDLLRLRISGAVDGPRRSRSVKC
jgi:hypothetical protein